MCDHHRPSCKGRVITDGPGFDKIFNSYIILGIISFGFNMHNTNWHTIWIIGAGRFGQLAARRICKARPQCAVTLVDPDPPQDQDLNRCQVWRVHADGIRFLFDTLDGHNDPDWIVPAAPVHVAYEWIRSRLSSRFEIEPLSVPSNMAHRLPNPRAGKLGTLYVSNATWICPDDCAEPPECCTVTGEAHPCIVYRELEKFQPDGFQSVVIRSRQLLPGVGGYTPQALFASLEKVRWAAAPVLLSTACRCHAVLEAFRLKPLDG